MIAAQSDAVIESAPIGIGLFDLQLRHVRVNPVLEEMNGLPAAKLLGRTPAQLHPEVGREAETLYREVLRSGRPQRDVPLTGTVGSRPGDAGDSAGGGIAVTTCLLARDAGLPMPAAVVAFSPGLDATPSGGSIDGKTGIDPFFTRESLGVTGAMYLADADPDQELLSPATRADLTGFPPLLLQVGTNEVPLDDSTRMAARARAAGVDVILDVTADVPHVFQSLTGILDEADQALDRAALFLTQHLRRS